MSNGTTVLIPPDGSGAFQAGQSFPGLQPARTVQYVQYAIGHQYKSLSNPPNRQELLKKLRKVESKTLGAIQIIIGLLFIGLGTIELILYGRYYFPFASTVGFPFWGGIFFVVSGSLSVSAEKYLDISLVKSSVGMNITSAVMAAIGTALYGAELALNAKEFPRSPTIFTMQSSGTGLAVFLLLLSILEFAITVTLAHFVCEATCCNNEMATTALPYAAFRQDGNPTEVNLDPQFNQSSFSSHSYNVDNNQQSQK